MTFIITAVNTVVKKYIKNSKTYISKNMLAHYFFLLKKEKRNFDRVGGGAISMGI